MGILADASTKTLQELRTTYGKGSLNDAHLILQGLAELKTAAAPVTAATATACQATHDLKTDSGNIDAGAFSVFIYNSHATVVATVDTKQLAPGTGAPFQSPPGMKLPAIPYDANGGELQVTVTRFP